MSRGRLDDKAAEQRQQGLAVLAKHPILSAISEWVQFLPDKEHRHVSSKAWLAVSPAGSIWFHPKRQADAAAWTRIAALAYVCLGFGFVRQREPLQLWEMAALLIANRFCDELKLGSLPETLEFSSPELQKGGVEALFKSFCTTEPNKAVQSWYTDLCGGEGWFRRFDDQGPSWRRRPDWTVLLANGITRGVGDALESVSGTQSAHPGSGTRRDSLAQRAKRQLMDYYPLLGALAASFDIEEDVQVCQQYDIRVAAIEVATRRVWMNPAAGLSQRECLFVFAHELLHAGLNHATRRRGRDPVLWNVACDFVINGWLVEMAVGSAPAIGLLLDARYEAWSAEDIYDDLATDIRRARKLATLRGVGAVDMLGDDDEKRFTDAEAYCRRALATGLDRCMYGGTQRGLIPAGLVEDIRSLAQAPIPWDVRLAEWFDERFPPPEVRRTYGRPSRRQGATPDIPRPSLAKPPEELRHSRVFGVVLDTSGSMEPRLLGMALGAIASYSLARGVAMVRLVCCDAAAYDAGWVEPEQLLDRFTLKGRGGTILQPGLDCLRALTVTGDFPKSGPVLIITDGYCEDHLDIPMDHAFVLPAANRLPFRARGPVFLIGESPRTANVIVV